MISSCGRYRYKLSRRWDPADWCLFVMLNPSTADALADDPTIRRCIGFTRSWGFGGLLVGNLYAWRATRPADLPEQGAEGRWNDWWLRVMARRASMVVCAWGANAEPERAEHVRALLGDAYHMGLTAGGQPRHPLYLPGATAPTPWPASVR